MIDAAGARDFPFYDGEPVRLSPVRWIGLLALVVLGFAALIGTPHVWPGNLGRWGGIAAFVGLPLLGLRLVAGRFWTAIFHRPTARDIWIGLAFVPATLAASGLVAVGLMWLTLTAANPSVDALSHLQGVELALFVAGTAPQLLGEELVTILPLLALLTAFNSGLKVPRRAAIFASWLISALIFAALHLPTYQWHVVQTLAIIGVARLVLSLPYLITKNVWSSTITHVTNDWLLFAFMFASRWMH